MLLLFTLNITFFRLRIPLLRGLLSVEAHWVQTSIWGYKVHFQTIWPSSFCTERMIQVCKISSGIWRPNKLTLKLGYVMIRETGWKKGKVSCTDKTKVKILSHNAHQHVQQKTSTAFQRKHLVPAVKYDGGGRVMIWVFFLQQQDLEILQSSSQTLF